MIRDEIINRLKNIKELLLVEYGSKMSKSYDAIDSAIELLEIPTIFREFEFKIVITSIPDNATNGDVIKIMFPNYESRYDPEYEIITGHLDKTHRHNFNLEWWNAPYKGGE